MRPDGLLRSCDARVKVIVAIVALIVAVSARQPATPSFVALFAIGTRLATGSREELRALARFVAAIATTALVTMLALALGHSVGAAMVVGARILGATSVTFWLLRSTAFPGLQSALGWFGVPSALLEILGYAHRYVGVLGEVLQTARDAQALRGGYSDVRRGVRSVGVLAGVVWIRAIDQTEVLADALALRGYRGELRPAPTPPLGGRELIVAAGAAAALAMSQLGPRYLPLGQVAASW